MAVVPVIPAFTFGDSSLLKLQQLSAAVSFTCRCPVIWHGYKTATQAISASTATAVTWVVMADSDGALTTGGASRYTAQTPGYFHVDAVIAGTTTSSDNAWRIYFQVTTGPNNPAGAGVTTTFGHKADDTGTAATVLSLSTSTLTPFMYVGDYLEVWVFATVATTLQTNFGNSGNLDFNNFPDGECRFTGSWWAAGP